MLPRSLPYRTRLLSALLALLVLATSVGLTAERHRCRISGRSTVALVLPGLPGHPDGDAPTRPGRPCDSQRSKLTKRRPTGCCDVSHVLHKLDASRHAGAAAKWLPELPQWQPALLPTPTWAGASGRCPLAASVAMGAAANSSPPGAPRAGRVLLTLHSTLVV